MTHFNKPFISKQSITFYNFLCNQLGKLCNGQYYLTIKLNNIMLNLNYMTSLLAFRVYTANKNLKKNLKIFIYLCKSSDSKNNLKFSVKIFLSELILSLFVLRLFSNYTLT